MGQVLPFPGSDPEDAAIGRRLKHWRAERGVEVEALADALKLSPEDIRRLESGRTHMSSIQMGAATRALRLPVWALVADRPVY